MSSIKKIEVFSNFNNEYIPNGIYDWTLKGLKRRHNKTVTIIIHSHFGRQLYAYVVFLRF